LKNLHFVFIYGRLSITLEFLWDCVHLVPVDNNAGSQDRDGKLEHAPSLQSRDCVASRSGDCQARWQETNWPGDGRRVPAYRSPDPARAARLFVDVTCLAVLAGPIAGEMSADIIIAPAVDREPRLAAVLSRLGRGLRPDGILFLGTAGSPIMTRIWQIQELLKQQGLAFVRTHLEPADIDLLCCRRIPALQAQAA
jgi:hypothetical protein